MSVYVCDFETTTDANDCRVWGWGSCNIDNFDVEIGNDIQSFIDWMRNDDVKQVYFHNLKFDSAFIISYLLQNDYEHVEKKSKNEQTFTTMMTDTGVFYSMDIFFEQKGRKKNSCKIMDSLKKLPFSVEAIAKAFDLEESKLKIDYDKKRPIGYTLTNEEIEYIKADVVIIAKAIKILLSQGMEKLTIGSDALNEFKKLFGKRNFERNFPVLDLEIDHDIRQAYRGGVTLCNKKYQNKDIKKGMVFDVNSMYPSIMYNRLLPYGIPIYFEGEYVHDATHPLYIQHIKCSFKIKKDHLPTIQIKNNFSYISTQFIEDSKGVTDLYLTNIDFKMFLEHYDVDYLEFVNGWKFSATKGLFKQYIDKWYEIKNTSEGALKTLAKLMLNSLYGKFGTHPKKRSKSPYLDDDDILRWELNESEMGEPVYVAMALFITSYGREMVLSTAQKNYDRFLYCDTDSVHIIGEDDVEIDVDAHRLGAWKHEGTFERARYLRAKTYVEEFHRKQFINVYSINIKGKMNKNNCFKGTVVKTKGIEKELIIKHLDVKCAGMPPNIKKDVTFDNFKHGLSLFGKLKPKSVKGGTILVQEDFTLKH